MRNIHLRTAVSVFGITLLLAGVAFLAHGGDISCNNQRTCVGTERADTIRQDGDNDTREIHALSGNDTILMEDNDNDSLTVLAGTGNDTLLASANGIDDLVLMGEDGDDTFRLDNEGTTRVNGGRGDDFIQIRDDIASDSVLIDGPGRDVINDENADDDYTIELVADNETDIVRLANNDSGQQTIRLHRGSGRDVIDCGDTDNDDGDVVFLNGNRKAVDPMGNNLFRAARLGGTAESNCSTIIP